MYVFDIFFEGSFLGYEWADTSFKARCKFCKNHEEYEPVDLTANRSH